MTVPIDICFLSSKHPPRDKRVYDKEALSLAKAGFRVAHLAPGPDSGASEGVEVKTYPPPRTLVDRITQIPRLFKLASSVDAACYHCNEVDSWFVGVLLKVFHRRKVVFDVHEIYPEEFAESRFPKRLQPLVASGVRLAIRAMLPFTDRIVFAKESAAPDYPVTPSKTVLVQNFTSIGAVDNRDLDKPATRNEGRRIRAVHLGLMGRERGWPQLLEAMKNPALRDVELLLIGEFPNNGQREFEAAADAAGVRNRIEIVPWLPFKEAFRLVQSSDIGLILFQPGRRNHVHALPHKMFDFMLAGLPVIAPNFAVEVARIVSEADCGILIDPSNPNDIARAVSELANDPARRDALGRRGRRAVLETYNWEGEAKKLIGAYTELLRDV